VKNIDMNRNEIVKGIYYVGINDRTTTLFERQWPLPYGVTYNSYLVMDEKCVLVDTVESAESGEYVEEIRRAAKGRDIDYLVVNHMEPDHSGSIPEIMRCYPDIKIVGNALTVQMIKGFYGINSDERFITVKDGDEISIGSQCMKFILTPMVHWPETMMTYLPETRLIFSGDAFGTFGALDSGVIDGELNIDIYLEEMYRYYSNIVGKYGKFVDNAFKKTAGLDIDYICPTHGPVWNSYIDRAFDIYNRLSHYIGEEGIVIVYASMYGNTAKLAEKTAQLISERGYKKIHLYDATSTPMSRLISECFKYDKLLIGTPTYQMDIFPAIDQLLKALESREIKNKTVGYFTSYAWAPKVAMLKMEDYLKRMDVKNIGGVEMKQGLIDAVLPELEMLADEITK